MMQHSPAAYKNHTEVFTMYISWKQIATSKLNYYILVSTRATLGTLRLSYILQYVATVYVIRMYCNAVVPVPRYQVPGEVSN